MVRVFRKDTNEELDQPLDFVVEVDDKNDNAPEFDNLLQFTVPEHSALGE